MIVVDIFIIDHEDLFYEAAHLVTLNDLCQGNIYLATCKSLFTEVNLMTNSISNLPYLSLKLAIEC